MTILASRILVRMLTNGPGSVTVTRYAVGWFSTYVVVRLNPTRDGGAYQQKQNEPKASGRLLETLE
jgi:hypothetical protein